VRSIAIALAAVALVTLVACGEKPTVTIYKQGTYQGKPDNQPWQSLPFNGNHDEWERTVRARSNSQNENVRMGLQ
jgi:hypothetical protein